MKEIVKEFKEFISRGSVVDLAVGIIVGGSFTLIVTSFVNDIVMPLISIIIGRINFTDMKLILIKESTSHAAVTMNYGNFIQVVVNFLLTSLAIFIFIKFINKFRKKEEKKEVKAVSDEVKLLTEIRDLLGKNSIEK